MIYLYWFRFEWTLGRNIMYLLFGAESSIWRFWGNRPMEVANVLAGPSGGAYWSHAHAPLVPRAGACVLQTREQLVGPLLIPHLYPTPTMGQISPKTSSCITVQSSLFCQYQHFLLNFKTVWISRDFKFTIIKWPWLRAC